MSNILICVVLFFILCVYAHNEYTNIEYEITSAKLICVNKGSSSQACNAAWDKVKKIENEIESHQRNIYPMDIYCNENPTSEDCIYD